MSVANRIQQLTILSGQTSSDAYIGGNMAAYGLQMPATFTGTAITYTVSANGTTFFPLYDATGAVLVTTATAASRCYALPDELTAWKAWKIVSGSSEGADRTLVIIGKAP